MVYRNVAVEGRARVGERRPRAAECWCEMSPAVRARALAGAHAGILGGRDQSWVDQSEEGMRGIYRTKPGGGTDRIAV